MLKAVEVSFIYLKGFSDQGMSFDHYGHALLLGSGRSIPFFNDINLIKIIQNFLLSFPFPIPIPTKLPLFSNSRVSTNSRKCHKQDMGPTMTQFGTYNFPILRVLFPIWAAKGRLDQDGLQFERRQFYVSFLSLGDGREMCPDLEGMQECEHAGSRIERMNAQQ